ncbi:uncharacterized protein LOC108664850 [Hyalella azteca]|uniref:Uncharacterized protein LOC108664850 n=1 Tax=Hyalella azteca TaxID=294128 RepID=A0A8B7MZP8_HYAAZ|nr:uncharacterized protein LOC108664850 [Hyalella azteca]
MLGALRCTPTAKLEAEASLSPLRFRRPQLLTAYCCRILTIPRHPVRQLLLEYYPFALYDHLPMPLPLPGRAHQEFKALQLTPNNIHTIPMACRYVRPRFPALSTLAVATKPSLSDEQWHQCFQDLISQSYSNHTLVYTDGSVSQDRSGCAVYSTNFNLQAKLPPDTSIFTSELYAIYCAIKFISLPGNFVVFCDSLSCISALRSNVAPTHFLVPWIIEACSQLTIGKLTLEWVPGHSGIAGNVAADALARAALNLANTTNLALGTRDWKVKIAKHYCSVWHTAWSTLPAHITKSNLKLDSLTPTELPRPQQVAITRLRLETCLLTHSHLFTKSPPLTCSSCHCQQTIKHIFIDCPLCTQQQHTLRTACQQLNLPFSLSTLFSPPFDPEMIIQFLRKTQLLDSI